MGGVDGGPVSEMRSSAACHLKGQRQQWLIATTGEAAAARDGSDRGLLHRIIVMV